jgi:hypothetical protein
MNEMEITYTDKDFYGVKKTGRTVTARYMVALWADATIGGDTDLAMETAREYNRAVTKGGEAPWTYVNEHGVRVMAEHLGVGIARAIMDVAGMWASWPVAMVLAAIEKTAPSTLADVVDTHAADMIKARQVQG